MEKPSRLAFLGEAKKELTLLSICILILYLGAHLLWPEKYSFDIVTPIIAFGIGMVDIVTKMFSWIGGVGCGILGIGLTMSGAGIMAVICLMSMANRWGIRAKLGQILERNPPTA
jgi:hypothetical protein